MAGILVSSSACQSVARRPSSGAAWWEEIAGSESTAHDSLASRDYTSTGTDSGATDSLLRSTPPQPALALSPPEGVSPAHPDSIPLLAPVSPEELRALQEDYDERTQQERERVKRVNEYVYWCIEHGMWDEAQIHLEQAVQIDSLSASLHNNLGIINERLGKRSQAESSYRLASRLNPDKKEYRTNLRRLRSLLEQRDALDDSVVVTRTQSALKARSEDESPTARDSLTGGKATPMQEKSPGKSQIQNDNAGKV
ncbi:MAG: hypothetical protein VX733_07495 [Candidatus Latescibacterota bacterium]|nr:hypothetical protein [Candidatus Latescibacterota bacterium]